MSCMSLQSSRGIPGQEALEPSGSWHEKFVMVSLMAGKVVKCLPRGPVLVRQHGWCRSGQEQGGRLIKQTEETSDEVIYDVR